MAEAAQASTAGDDTRAAALAKEALGLWRGPVLAGVPLHLDGAGGCRGQLPLLS